MASKFNVQVTILEKEDTVAAGVSSGNSGLGCTGYDAPPGSLEQRLLRRSIQIHQNLYRSFGLSHEHVRKCGSLVVAWTNTELKELENVLKANKEAGDTDACILTRDELLALEPGLSPEALGAVLLPREAVVEPWLVPIAYAESARQLGVRIETSRLVTGVSLNADDAWCLHTCGSNDQSSGRSKRGEIYSRFEPNRLNNHLDDKKVFTSKIVINCAGLFGDEVERMRSRAIQTHAVTTSNHSDIDLYDPPTFTVTPRKGQYIVFKSPVPNEKTYLSDIQQLKLPQHIIEPVATEFTKGVIVWTTIYGNVIVGPTAVDVSSKCDRSTDQDTIEMLRKYAEKVIPSLKYAEIVGTYSCLRPATQYRDYQIYQIPKQNWITVGGIRSTGLTACSGIGEYVGNLYQKLKNYDEQFHENTFSEESKLLGVTESADNPDPIKAIIGKSTPQMVFPTLAQLAADYKKNINTKDMDGYVTIFGRPMRVTHPISSFGMEHYAVPSLSRDNAVSNVKEISLTSTR